MSYSPIEYNNYACVKMKEIIYPYVVLNSCENFGLSDLVKFSTCKNRNFLMPFYGTHVVALVVAVSDLIICVCCLQFY